MNIKARRTAQHEYCNMHDQINMHIADHKYVNWLSVNQVTC